MMEEVEAGAKAPASPWPLLLGRHLQPLLQTDKSMPAVRQAATRSTVQWNGRQVHAPVLSLPQRPGGPPPKQSYVGLNLGLWPASSADSKTRTAGAGESCLALLYRSVALDCKVRCVIVPVGKSITFIFQFCRYREFTPVKICLE